MKICREANDILADMVKKHPDRFAAFATLPMADFPTEAAKELEALREGIWLCGEP